MIKLIIKRAWIEEGDTSEIVKTLASFSSNKKDAMEALGNVAIQVSGYDDDLRELWMIREARDWFSKLEKEVPHLLFFLNPESKSHLFYAMMTGEVTLTKGSARIDYEILQKFLMQGFLANNAFCKANGLNPQCPELIRLSLRMLDTI